MKNTSRTVAIWSNKDGSQRAEIYAPHFGAREHRFRVIVDEKTEAGGLLTLIDDQAAIAHVEGVMRAYDMSIPQTYNAARPGK